MSDGHDPDLLPAFPAGLGIRLTKACPDHVTGEFDVTDAHANRNGVMHGGAVLAFADTLGGVAAKLNLEEGQATTTIESKSNFLRPVPIGQTARACCEPLHLGRKTAIFQITVTRADGKVAAIVTQTQMTLDWSRPRD